MSRAAFPSYQKPAAVLALMVHGGFFALLYFGFTWQSKPPVAAMAVELWGSLPLPVTVVAATPEPASLPPIRTHAAEPAVVDVIPSRVEIALSNKQRAKKQSIVNVTPVMTNPPQKIVNVVALSKPAATIKPVEKEVPLSDAERAADRELAMQAALKAGEVDTYKAKIMQKIRGNIVMPPDVDKAARAEFWVTLLPGGGVLSARLTQSSGDVGYDTAVERAILKSQPLPLPTDANLFNQFRELKLKFKPVE
jgi:colicin import membrane protein